MKNLSQNSGKIGLSICEIIIGILLFMDPMGFTGTIIKIVGVILLIAGVWFAIRYFRTDPVAAHLEQGLTKALLAIFVGAFCLLKSEWFLATFPIITVLYGIIIILTAVVRIQWTVDMLRMKMDRWYIPGIGAVISLIFGVIILTNPFAWSTFLWTFVAISMIVDAVFDLCTVIFIKTVEPETKSDTL